MNQEKIPKLREELISTNKVVYNEENLNLLEANRKKQMKIINSILDHFEENEKHSLFFILLFTKHVILYII